MLGALVLVIAVIALQEPNGHVSTAGTPTGHKTVAAAKDSTPTASKKHHPSTSPPASPKTSDPHAIPLVVLNDTSTSGLAAGAAKRFESGGWKVTSSDNLPSDITDVISTVAYYDPSVSGAKSAALALQRQYPTIKRVVPRFAQLPSGPIVVVLTPDYQP